MSSWVDMIHSSIVARSRRGRSCKALSKRSRPRAPAAAGDTRQPRGSELRFEHGDGDCAIEVVGDISFEGIGLETYCEVGLATVSEGRENRLCRRRNRSRIFAGTTTPAILATFKKWDRCKDAPEVVIPGDSVIGRRAQPLLMAGHAKAGAPADLVGLNCRATPTHGLPLSPIVSRDLTRCLASPWSWINPPPFPSHSLLCLLADY
jgi:hypothetical protein